ncbi:hypothetical protein C1646_749054 [Rhizophagus diaphanus]|nr:hypothetical protein C1646_749054 [Rhizophagus diaphanus] [Rhizophagus sp. MUCL 43196]
MTLVYEEYKTNIWPDRFKHKYDLLLAESSLKEAIVMARIIEEFSDLTTVLHQDLNYNWHWAVNEAGEILDKAIGYNNHLKEYDSIEVYGVYTLLPVPPQHEYNNIRMLKELQILFLTFDYS